MQRATTGGFARGSLLIKSFSSGDDILKLEFQNENLVAYRGSKVIASVPNLITVVETESGLAVQTEDLRFGMRVSALAIPAPERLLTKEALEVVGPKAFGFDFEEPVI